MLLYSQTIPNLVEAVCGSSFSPGNKIHHRIHNWEENQCHLYWPLNSKFIQGTPLSPPFNQFNSHKYSSLLNKHYNITSQHISNNPSQIKRTRKVKATLFKGDKKKTSHQGENLSSQSHAIQTSPFM